MTIHVHSFIRQIFLEHILCTWAKWWRCSSEQSRQKPVLSWSSCFSEGRQTINKIEALVYGVVIVLQRTIKTANEKSKREVQFKIEWSGRASLTKWYLGKHLKKIKEQTMWLIGGKTYQAEGSTRIRALGLEIVGMKRYRKESKQCQ